MLRIVIAFPDDVAAHISSQADSSEYIANLVRADMERLEQVREEIGKLDLPDEAIEHLKNISVI